MLSMRRPSPHRVEVYRIERIEDSPTCRPDDHLPSGFRHESFSRVVGTGSGVFERAREGLEQWAAHRGASIDVFPVDAELVRGSTVALVSRQLGLWILAACRIERVIAEPARFGFVYATLPDHPECGYESFVVTLTGDEVTFDIEAVSKPGIALVELGAPVARLLQRRAASACLDALATWVDSPPR